MNKSEALELLGLNSRASLEDAKKAFGKKLKETHPDLNPNRIEWATRQTARVNKAFEVLEQYLDQPKSYRRSKPWESQQQWSSSGKSSAQTEEQRAREQRARERAKEQRAKEQRAKEQRAEEKRAREQRAREQAKERREREKKAQEQARKEQAIEDLAIAERAAQIHEARKNGTLTELLRSWGEVVPEKKKQKQYKYWANSYDHSPRSAKQDHSRNWKPRDNKQTQPRNTSGCKKNYSNDTRETKETTGPQRFREFIRFLINELIYLFFRS